MSIRHTERRPPNSLYQQLGRQHDAVLKRAAAVSTDRAIKGAAAYTKQAMRNAGLGRLANAVGNTSSLRQGRAPSSNSYGAIYARGGDDSLAGGALEAYSRGTTIKPIRGAWLWFQTKAIQRTAKVGVGRRRLTPAIYNAMGAPLGPLQFRRIRPDLAILYAEKVVVNPRTGRARRPGPRNRKPVDRRVTVFMGIRNTRRTKRFDVEQIVGRFAGLVPAYMADEIRKALNSGAGVLAGFVQPDNRR